MRIMKTIMLLIASLAVAALLLTSCGSSQECPAYSQASMNGATVNSVA